MVERACEIVACLLPIWACGTSGHVALGRTILACTAIEPPIVQDRGHIARHSDTGTDSQSEIFL